MVHKQYYLLIFVETIVNDLDTADDKVYWKIFIAKKKKKKYNVSQQRSKKIYRALKNKGNNVGWHCTSRLHRIDEFFHHVEPNDIQLSHWWRGKRQEWIWANYRFVLKSLKTKCSNLKVCRHFLGTSNIRSHILIEDGIDNHLCSLKKETAAQSK